MSSKVKTTPKNIGVINPYALAEVKLKRRINWKRIADPRKLLEDTLCTPYSKLFDPKFKSPLYSGLRFDPKTKSMRRIERPSKKVQVRSAFPTLESVTVWADPGDFFEEGTEFTDPVQGAVGDCYFIAALASVAWARPYVIAQRTRATGPTQQAFVDMIEVHAGGRCDKVEVSELVPLMSPGNLFVYARSSESGEIWPAIYEKAFARWVIKQISGADPGDQPDIARISGGDPVAALERLTGLTPYYYSTSHLTPAQIYGTVRANCYGVKTFNPMVAWTYSSGDASPDHVNYSDANLVANHAYSILGCQGYYFPQTGYEYYVVLRNPWGTYEPSVNVLNWGQWVAWDQPYSGGPGYWRRIDWGIKTDGIFALRAEIFKKYFEGFGLVK